MNDHISLYSGGSAESVCEDVLNEKAPTALLLIFFGAEFDYKSLFYRLHEAGLPFIGCMDTGRLINETYRLDETSAVAMRLSPEIIENVQIVSYDMRPAAGYDAIKLASKNLFQNALERMGIDQKDPDLERVFAINLVHGLMSANPVLEGQNEASLFFQTVGGSSGGKLDFKAAPVISSKGMGPIGATAVVKLRPEYRYAMDLTSSFEPTEHRLKVTGMNGPRHITEFNGRPAVEEYARVLGLDGANLDPATFATYTLGLETGDGERLITSIQREAGDGGLLTYNDTREGVNFYVYRAVSQLPGRKSRLGELPADRMTAFISFDCVLCYLARQSQDEIQTIADNYAAVLPGVPKIGFGTFSENFCGANVNQTETFLAIMKA